MKPRKKAKRQQNKPLEATRGIILNHSEVLVLVSADVEAEAEAETDVDVERLSRFN